jgi:hypothetical protein
MSLVTRSTLGTAIRRLQFIGLSGCVLLTILASAIASFPFSKSFGGLFLTGAGGLSFSLSASRSSNSGYSNVCRVAYWHMLRQAAAAQVVRRKQPCAWIEWISNFDLFRLNYPKLHLSIFSESVVRNRNKINFHNSLTFTMIVEQICSLLWIAAIRLLLKIEYVYQMQALTLRYISVSPC